jgi:hypothetical protein
MWINKKGKNKINTYLCVTKSGTGVTERNIYMKTTTEQKMTMELSYEQYKHIQEVLKQDKPSRTKLSRDEKDFITYCLNSFLSEHPYADEDNLAKNIIKKLK